MLGFPTDFKNDVQIFRANTAVAGVGKQRWQRPPGASMVHMLCVGGGCGGGGGCSRASGADGGGGGGGASSGFNGLLVPALFLPETLYITVGSGGAGAAADGTGVVGGISLISTDYRLTAWSGGDPSLILGSWNNSPTAGGPGTVTAAGAAGAVSTSILIANRLFTCSGFIAAPAVGQAGAAGGVHTGAVGASLTIWSPSPVSGGAGGGGSTGTEFNGGAQNAGGTFNLGPRGNFTNGSTVTSVGVGGSATAKNGGAGLNYLFPFLSSGGGGGGTVDNGTGGDGGPGGYGSGGAGGGAGVTGGKGGRGGDGVVVIISW